MPGWSSQSPDAVSLTGIVGKATTGLVPQVERFWMSLLERSKQPCADTWVKILLAVWFKFEGVCQWI